MTPSPHARLLSKILLSALACLWTGHAGAAKTSVIANPIGKIARILDPQLVKNEDRVSWLNTQISTLAEHHEHAMKVGLGCRGYRATADAPDPSITLDMGAVHPIEKIFLIPTQREFLEDSGIFPKRYTLEISNRADFAQRSIVLTIPRNSAAPVINDGNPVPIEAQGKARYVRLTVHEGHNKGMIDLFGLSEILVSTNLDTVSFGATVTCVGELNAQGIWYPQALTDGRCPLGIWQNGTANNSSPGDSVAVSDTTSTVSWTITLPQTADLDRLVLFPYKINRAYESSVLPDSLTVQLLDENGQESQAAYQWSNPIQGVGSMTPLIIPLGGKSAKSIRLTGIRPYSMGEIKMHALSEIEIWSQGTNLARSLPVTRSYGTESSIVTSLTDGYTSDKRIMPAAIWLDQLAERGKIERELNRLYPVTRALASESELNATWGSAVILGLTFLIPVFIVERRRLMSREQLDVLRKRIASDLHDDIGSNLGSISLIARSARKDLVRLHGPEEVADDLGEVESIARESSLAIRDIVWLLERRQDSIGDLVQRMRDTADRLLREINFTLECDSNKTAARLSLDAKRHLFLFYKEAIHNVLKHSHADRVTIRLSDVNDQLSLEIIDNGIGLPLNESQNPTAVHKLQDRARVLEGLLKITSSKESGTSIRLLVKRSHLTSHPSLA